MSFSKRKREQIMIYLLEKIDSDDTTFMKKVSENFEITTTSVRRYIKDLLSKDMIVLDNKKQCGYRLNSTKQHFTYENKLLDESTIFFNDISVFLSDDSIEAQRIWAYAFTEICNNAIEHSQCTQIDIKIRKNMLYTDIIIQDNGIGIFNNIISAMPKNRTPNISDAILELYKGKFTSNPKSHSGEGIFFSSKMVDSFIIQSGSCMFKESLGNHEYMCSHLLSYYHKFQDIGSRVIMRVSNQSRRSPKEVFDMFCNDEFQFCKTKIPVKEINPMAYPVSRSEAKRMLRRMENFTDITLDFIGVDEMGQGFAHEVFVVFQDEHPDVKFHVENASTMVQKMISHVLH